MEFNKRHELNGPIIATQEDLEKIPDLSAREIARYLLSLNKYLIAYESVMFEHRNSSNEFCAATIPDFNLVEMESGEESFIEGTMSDIYYRSRGNTEEKIAQLGLSQEDFIDPVYVMRDPKERQKRVMELVAPDVSYTVWSARELMQIQRENPGYDFFKNMSEPTIDSIAQPISTAA